jgi:hypothetical protein
MQEGTRKLVISWDAQDAQNQGWAWWESEWQDGSWEATGSGAVEEVSKDSSKEDIVFNAFPEIDPELFEERGPSWAHGWVAIVEP